MNRSTVRAVFLAVVVLTAFSGCFEFATDDDSEGALDDGTETADAGTATESEDADTETETETGTETETEAGTETEPAENGTEPAFDEVGESEDPEDAALERAEEHDDVVAATFLDPAEETTVSLELATTYEERQVGLMNRTSLPDHHGMVFVYPGEDHRTFWMKNTYVPLDIVFLDENRTVRNVEHAEPQPDAADDDLETYGSDGMAQYVIELERGFANETGIEPGVEVEFDEELEAED